MSRVHVIQTILSPIPLYITLVTLYFFFLHERLIIHYNRTSGKLENESPERLGGISPLAFKYSENPKHLCTGVNDESKLTLLVLVCSSVSNVKERDVIRRTWGSIASRDNATSSARVGFILGTSSDFDLQKQIQEESLMKRDIIQLDFVDSYKNLTLKSIMLLKWVTEYCPNVDYVLKTSDDVYVNVPTLIKSLKELSVISNVMYGQLFKKPKRIRHPAHMLSIPKKHYQEDVINYLSGSAYVMSRDAVPKLLEASAEIPLLSSENMYITGLCASRHHVKIYHMEGFANWRRPPTGCNKKALIAYNVSIREMALIWERQQKNPTCTALAYLKKSQYKHIK